MNRTNIEWTDFTANPLKYRDKDVNVVWACVHASEGCRLCYSEALAHRYKRGLPFTKPNMDELTPFLDEAELHRMRTYKPAAGKRCFVGDMTDIFGEWVPDQLLHELFSNTLEMRENVQWQILTKRAARMQKYMSWRWGEGRIPMRNIWLGVSVEDQETADERIPLLLQAPAAVRFVSYEPALEGVDFRRWLTVTQQRDRMLDWVIIGGESGPGARPFNIQWARDVIAQCKAADVACFVKQIGSRFHFGRSIDVEYENWPRWNELKVDASVNGPATFIPVDRKGGDISEWAEDLRVRQFPRERVTV